jgi:hypothetical protein
MVACFIETDIDPDAVCDNVSIDTITYLTFLSNHGSRRIRADSIIVQLSLP